jgi:hypothetical protein
LTPVTTDPEYPPSESEDDDENLLDEEEALAATLGPGLTFHDSNGEMLSLTTAADLLEWKRARAKNFPTRTRIAQKYEEKRLLGAERRKLLTEASEMLRKVTHPRVENLHQGIGPERMKRTVAAQERKAASFRNKLSQSELKSAASEAVAGVGTSLDVTMSQPAIVQDLIQAGDPANESHGPESVEKHANDSGAVQPDMPDASADNSADSSTPSLDVESSNDSDDEPPEESSTKPQPQSTTKSIRCKYFTASGYCREGDACRYKHELTPAILQQRTDKLERRKRDPFAPSLDAPAADAKKTIHQRLMERQEGDEDQLALRVIKYLGQAGLFAQAANRG